MLPNAHDGCVDDLRLKDILGLPFVPPPRVTQGALRVRSGIEKTHRGMAPPAVRVLESLFGLFENRVLGLLVQLQIPEALSTPKTIEDLSAECHCDPPSLLRVMRYAAGLGFVDMERSGSFSANATTEILRRDHPNSWAGWVEFATSDWFWDAWREAGSAIALDPVSGMEKANGSSFFDFLVDNPSPADSFDRAMAAGATMQGLALSRTLDWRKVSTVCDVGGGTGAALRMILANHAGLDGVVFDLPSVVARAPATERMRVEGGDFFATVPSGCDRYLLLAVIHDWNDEQATRILRNVAAAMPEDGRAFVVENIMPEKARGDFVEASDVLMLVVGSGRERTLSELEQLFKNAGLDLRKAHRLPTGFIAFELAS